MLIRFDDRMINKREERERESKEWFVEIVIEFFFVSREMYLWIESGEKRNPLRFEFKKWEEWRSEKIVILRIML